MQDSSPVIILVFLISFGFTIFLIAAQWKVFTKAGQPGWAALIPILNGIVFLKIVEKPVWWVILFLIPLVNIVVGFIVNIELAQRFGKTTGFGVGMTLLPFIFIPILGFGDAKYEGYVEPVV